MGHLVQTSRITVPSGEDTGHSTSDWSRQDLWLHPHLFYNF